jgi:hypothetical protein
MIQILGMRDKGSGIKRLWCRVSKHFPWFSIEGQVFGVYGSGLNA